MGEGGSLARSFNINGGARRKGVILLRFQTIETGIINLQTTRLSSTLLDSDSPDGKGVAIAGRPEPAPSPARTPQARAGLRVPGRAVCTRA